MTTLVNDGGPIVVCSTCGCVVTEKIAAERRWGTIRVPHGARMPQCTKACAEVLYDRRWVAKYWEEGSP
jgi:hypothetical protein